LEKELKNVQDFLSFYFDNRISELNHFKNYVI